jgi:hypothetical protein
MSQSDLFEKNSTSVSPISQKRTRTEKVDITFKKGLAEGWAFGVSEAFRETLDILYVERRKQKVPRWVWTRGVPPARSFGQGHVFYDPPRAHGRVREELLPIVDAETAAWLAEATRPLAR